MTGTSSPVAETPSGDGVQVRRPGLHAADSGTSSHFLPSLLVQSSSTRHRRMPRALRRRHRPWQLLFDGIEQMRHFSFDRIWKR
jgi:hypothetical protein